MTDSGERMQGKQIVSLRAFSAPPHPRKGVKRMTEFKSGVDLTLMEGVLRQYQEDSTSLIMIL